MIGSMEGSRYDLGGHGYFGAPTEEPVVVTYQMVNAAVAKLSYTEYFNSLARTADWLDKESVSLKTKVHFPTASDMMKGAPSEKEGKDALHKWSGDLYVAARKSFGEKSADSLVMNHLYSELAAYDNKDANKDDNKDDNSTMYMVGGVLLLAYFFVYRKK